MQCTSVTYLLPGQGNGFIMCAQSFENIDAIENRGSTTCYNFNVLENWQREGDTKDDRSTACESFYFIYGKDYYNVSYKDSWVLNGLGEPAVKKKNKFLKDQVSMTCLTVGCHYDERDPEVNQRKSLIAPLFPGEADNSFFSISHCTGSI